MLRSEIAKLVARIEEGLAHGKLPLGVRLYAEDVLSELRPILDADPMERLAQLDRSVILMGQEDGTIRVSAVYLDEQSEMVEAGAHPDAIHDAAERLLARLVEPKQPPVSSDDETRLARITEAPK